MLAADILPPSPRVHTSTIAARHFLKDFHESENDTEVTIPFTVNHVSDFTESGIPLGEGQQVKSPDGARSLSVVFDLMNDQWIHLSEVLRWCNVGRTPCDQFNDWGGGGGGDVIYLPPFWEETARK